VVLGFRGCLGCRVGLSCLVCLRFLKVHLVRGVLGVRVGKRCMVG
jgi:hypothetical protein